MDAVEQLDDLEAEAKRRAIKYVSNLLQTPDKLDNIQQIKINVARKKASVETALKTAVQKQLEGNFRNCWLYLIHISSYGAASALYIISRIPNFEFLQNFGPIKTSVDKNKLLIIHWGCMYLVV